MAGSFSPGHPALGQQGPPPEFRRLTEIEARFHQAAENLDRSKLAALASLASNARGEESEAAFREAFNLAVARNLYAEAEPAAKAYLAREDQGEPQSQALAASIVLVNRAARGEYEQSLADLEGFPQTPRGSEDSRGSPVCPPALVFAVAEAYLQRLIQGGRYDIAQKVCQLAVANHPDPGVKAYFERRKARIELIGKPRRRSRGPTWTARRFASPI